MTTYLPTNLLTYLPSFWAWHYSAQACFLLFSKIKGRNILNFLAIKALSDSLTVKEMICSEASCIGLKFPYVQWQQRAHWDYLGLSKYFPLFVIPRWVILSFLQSGKIWWVLCNFATPVTKMILHSRSVFVSHQVSVYLGCRKYNNSLCWNVRYLKSDKTHRVKNVPTTTGWPGLVITALSKCG